MITVFAKVSGGREVTVKGVSTVDELISHLGLVGNYTIVIDGETAGMYTTLEEGMFVALAKSVKGGAKGREIIFATDKLKVVKDGKFIIINGAKAPRKDIKKLTNALLESLGYNKL